MIQARRGEPDTLLLKPRRRRRLLTIPLFAVLILAVASGALWLFAVSRAGAVMEAELQKEADRGRVWSCPQRSFTGFPLEIALRCVGPTFAGVAGGERINASAKDLSAAVRFYRPDRAVSTLEGPLDVQTEAGRSLRLEWKKLEVTAQGLPFGLDRVAVDADAPKATLTPAAADVGSASAAGISLTVHKLAPEAPDRPDAEATAHLAEAAVPLLDRLLGSNDLLTGDVAASVTAAAALQRGSLEDRLDAWRTAKGRLDIVHLSLVKGNAHVEASGTLTLDDAHRLQGEVVASFTGMDDVLKRFGVPSKALAFKGLLGGLLGGQTEASPKPEAAAPMSPDAIRLKLVFADGRVMLGPFRLPVVLRAVY